MPKTYVTTLTLLQSLVIFVCSQTQRLDPEVSQAPSGLLGTEALLRNLTVNIQVGRESSNSALKKREASLEEGKKKITPFPFIFLLRTAPGRSCKMTNEPEIWISKYPSPELFSPLLCWEIGMVPWTSHIPIPLGQKVSGHCTQVINLFHWL